MKKKINALLVSVLVICMTLCGSGLAVSADSQTVKGKITVDGSLDDWENVPEQKSTDSAISWWKTAKDADGNLYLCFTGQASTQWYGDYGWKYLTLKNDSGTDSGFQINNTESTTGGTLSTVNSANGQNAAPYYVELMVPASYIASHNITSMTFAGTGVNLSDADVMDGKEEPKKDEDNSEYKGIKIDGNFRDWNAVTKYDAKCPSSDHPNCLSKAAMVFDGDHVYIYVEEGPGGSAAGAGSHGNGNFVVETDLGRKVMLHFNRDNTVTSSQVKNIECRHVGSQWEVSFPADQLPAYKNTISFGLYSAESTDHNQIFVKDVSNIDGSNGNAGDFTGISYDGKYSDWVSYPHSLIQYQTAGDQAELVDGESAIYANGDKVYGNVYTELQKHLDEHGGEMTNTVTIRINKEQKFYPRFITVDEQGNINWNPQFTGDGKQEYYIVDLNSWSNAQTIDQLNSGKYGPNKVYGKMYVTTDSSKRDECEYYMDIGTLASKFGMNANDVQYIEQRFGRIGQQWVGTAGTSTNPALGVGICIAVTGGALLWRKRRKAVKRHDNAAGAEA